MCKDVQENIRNIPKKIGVRKFVRCLFRSRYVDRYLAAYNKVERPVKSQIWCPLCIVDLNINYKEVDVKGNFYNDQTINVVQCTTCELTC